MAITLYRIGQWCFTNGKKTIAIWLAIFVAAGFMAFSLHGKFDDVPSIGDVPSEQAGTLFTELFPDAPPLVGPVSAHFSFRAPEGTTLRDEKNMRVLDDVIARLKAIDTQGDTSRLANPVTASEQQFKQALKAGIESGQSEELSRKNALALLPLSADSRTGTTSIGFLAEASAEMKPEHLEGLKEAAEIGRAGGLQVEFGGQAVADTGKVTVLPEVIGITLAAIILTVMFGSLVAAGLPLITAILGVGISAMATLAAAAFTDLNSSTPVLGVMLGLAVAIDYALFILSRYQYELRSTTDKVEAIGKAVGTAGSAVVFAGLTVVIALSALMLSGIPFLGAMGVAASGAVLLAVLIALTFLPAILGIVKDKAFGWRIPALYNKAEAAHHVKVHPWVKKVQSRPILFAVGAIAVCGIMAIPLPGIQLGLISDATSQPDTTQRKHYELVAEGFGNGVANPILVVVDARETSPATEGIAVLASLIKGNKPELTEAQAAKQAAFSRVVTYLTAQKDIEHAQVVAVNPTGDGATIVVLPRASQRDPSTADTIRGLRSEAAVIQATTGATIGITGLMAIQEDISETLSNAFIPYFSVVIGLAIILLLLVFRSILIPLIATLGFVFTVAATFGLTVLIYNDGIFPSWVAPGPLTSFLPIFGIGVVFGLAMDYQVFLVTRMREEYVSGRSAQDAIVAGFNHGARVVIAAALIMTAVFAGFIFQDEIFVQSMGFALALAVFVDAFVIRMTLVPALLTLLGDKAWWIPKWLDRILPNVDVEGESLKQLLEPTQSPQNLHGHS